MTGLPRIEWTSADPEALRTVFEIEGVDRSLTAPGWGEYLSQLFGTLIGGLASWLAERFEASWLASMQSLLAWILVAAVVSVGGLVVYRVVRSRRTGAIGNREWVPASPARSDGGGLDAEAWRVELRHRLAEGRLKDALEALWWWVARRLDPRGLDESWTTDEMLAAAGPHAAADLRGGLRQLDRLRYGGGTVESAAVEALVDRLGPAPEESPGDRA